MLSVQNIKQLLDTGKPVYWTLHDMWAFTGGCHHSGNCVNFQQSCGNCQEFMILPSENDLSHQRWKKKLDAFQAPNLHIITCSNWLKNRAISSSILKNHRIESIPNAIDTELFRPAEVNQILFRNFENPEKAIEELLSLQTQDLYGFTDKNESATPIEE